VATGCFKNSNSIAVFVPCREGEELINDEQINIILYPNPANDKIYLKMNNSLNNSAQIVICDATGKTVLTQTYNGNETTIDISSLAPGIYLVQSVSDIQIYNSTFIKQ